MHISWPNLDWLKRSLRNRWGSGGRRDDAVPAVPRHMGFEEIAAFGELPNSEFEIAPADEQRYVAVRVLRSTLYSHQR